MRRPSTIALLVAIASFAAAGRASSADVPDLASAHAALARGAIAEAITLYTELLQEGSLTGQPLAIAYRERGISQQKAGFARHSVADYTNALWLDVLPSQLKAETYISRGVAYLELGQLQRADQDFSHALAIDGGLAEAYFGRGTIKRLNGKPEKSLADYGRALSLNCVRPELVHYGRALAYEALGNRQAAVAGFRKAAVIAPGLEIVRAKLAELGEPLPLSNGATPQHTETSPTIVTLADAGDLIFAEAQSNEPTGAIPSSANNTSSTTAEESVAAVGQGEPEPPNSDGTQPPDENLSPPLLRPGSDGPLARKDAIKRAAPLVKEAPKPVPSKIEQKSPSEKPAATLGASPDIVPSSYPPILDGNSSKVATAAQSTPIWSGQYFVQVAAFNKRESADKGLSDFSAAFPEFSNTAHLFVEAATIPGKGTVYRLRAGPFESDGAAEATCRGLSAQGQDCLVVPPRSTAQN